MPSKNRESIFLRMDLLRWWQNKTLYMKEHRDMEVSGRWTGCEGKAKASPTTTTTTDM